MSGESIYGPFLDEELFSYHDTRNIIKLESLEIFHTELGFIGFDDLETIHNQGQDGSFDNVMFSGTALLLKTSCLCETGFKKLLKEVEKEDPTMSPDKLRKYCKQGKIKIEIHCQLALMPVCYLTKHPPDSILIYSRNYNNMTGQRRYIVDTFHIACFRRSELTLQRYMVLKFIVDACTRYRNDVPLEDRDVHWLVNVYVEDYGTVFARHQRPRLHRSEVYDHFATHAKWLKKVFIRKALIDKGKWAEWMVEVKHLKREAKRANLDWGIPITRPVVALHRQHSRQVHSASSGPLQDEDYIDQGNSLGGVGIISDLDMEVPLSELDEESSTESDSSDDGDVHYTHDPSLRSLAHPGLFQPMPLPTWYWACNIKEGCLFVIDLGSKGNLDTLCMEPLSANEKDYLRGSVWGLYDIKLGKIWRKICQYHMDWHWREAGLVLDHEKKRIYSIEEED